MPKVLIGLAGKMASGKGRFGSYLVDTYDADRIRSSDPLRKVLDIFGVPQSRENLSALSTFIRSTYGEDTIVKAMENLLLASPKEIAIWDGMRRRIDEQYFRKFSNFYLVYIHSTPDVRYARYISRNENPGDGEMTREEFDKRDMAETEEEIEQLKNHADFVIHNETNMIEDLDRQIEDVIGQIMKK